MNLIKVNKKLIIFLLLTILTVISVIVIKYEKRIKKLTLTHQNKITSLVSTSHAISLENIPLLDSLNFVDLHAGKQEMHQHKLIITGITRDNLAELPIMKKHLEYIGSFFQDYRIILFENDSSDGTKAALATWSQNNPKLKIINHDFSNTKRPSHQFMANARNYYIDAMEGSEYKDFDMVMVIDMDMHMGIDIRGIADSFSKINQWDAVCSNGIRSSNMNQMYDFFAFRNDDFPWTPGEWQNICQQNHHNNKWTEICQKGMSHLTKDKDLSSYQGSYQCEWQKPDSLYWILIVPQGQKIYPMNSPLIPVQSCFGGMAFYKRAFVQDCRYNSIDNDCEHIVFHQCLKDKHHGKMMMNPNQVIRYD